MTITARIQPKKKISRREFQEASRQVELIGG
jgi:hypothetical protein